MQKTILVTGANRGIGLEISRQLAEKGHTVLMGTRKPEEAAKKAAVFGLGNLLLPCALDVTDEQQCIELASKISTDHGKLDVLVNNAGIISSYDTSNAPISEVRGVFDTNFFGVWQLTQALIPLLKKSPDGRIINMSSGMGAADDLYGDHAAYRLSKYALNGLTQSFANELKHSNIKVNAMCPGWVRTDMGGKAAPRPVEQGADTAVWLATADNISTGHFFRDRRVINW